MQFLSLVLSLCGNFNVSMVQNKKRREMWNEIWAAPWNWSVGSFSGWDRSQRSKIGPIAPSSTFHFPIGQQDAKVLIKNDDLWLLPFSDEPTLIRTKSWFKPAKYWRQTTSGGKKLINFFGKKYCYFIIHENELKIHNLWCLISLCFDSFNAFSVTVIFDERLILNETNIEP